MMAGGRMTKEILSRRTRRVEGGALDGEERGG